MNYQLMSQTIAGICSIVLFVLGIVILGEFKIIPRNYKVFWVITFVITIIFGALAAGLS